MKGFLVGLLLALTLAAAERTGPTRQELAAVEKSLDGGIRRLDPNEPYDLLGFTRGVYVPGYGVVLSAEVNLVITFISPFSPPPKGVRLTQLREKKLRRLGPMREWMRRALVEAASALDLPPNDQVVLGITFFYRGFEERQGLPAQIVMRCSRQKLLDFKENRISRAALDAAIQVNEL
jgi:hypothetical protein